MKPSFSLITYLSLLLVITSADAWSSTQPNRSISTPIATTATTENIQKIAQAITVKILIKNTAGSGIIIGKENNTYTVITNAHVVNRGEPYQIKTPDGKIYQAILKSKEDENAGNDLAALEFNSNLNYAVAQLAEAETVDPNQEVYAAGFPYDSPTLTFTKGKISLLSEKPLKGGYQIGYTNETVQGMSGGALLNSEGKVIGILGMGSQAILDEAYTYIDNTHPDSQTLAKLREIGFAVPSNKFNPLVANNNKIQKPNYTGIVAQIDEIARQITVRIDSGNNGNGSGVIVAHQGDTYYVLTAAHVVQNQDEYQIITPDGESYSVNNATIKIFEGADMAVLQFSSQKPYTVAKLGKYNLGLEKINVKQNNKGWIFVSGFPAVTATNGNPPKRQLTAGRIWGKEVADFTVKENYSLFGGQDLVYTAMSYGGMSGGPILDNQGRVIGINTGAEIEIENDLNLGQSLGVPIGTFIRRITEANITQNWLTIETSKPSSTTDADLNFIRTQLLTLQAPSVNSNPYDWLNYCNGLWRSFQFDEAVAACDQAIKQKADFYQAYYLKGLSLYYPKNYQQALSAFKKATEIDPQFYPAWGWLGSTLYELKQYSEALSAYDQAISINKDNLVWYVEKGDVLRELKRYPEAIEIYTEALKIKQHSWAYNNRGIAYRDLKDYQKAIADFNQAISLNPELTLAYNNRGLVYRDLKDNSLALTDFNQAISIDPEYADAYYNRGLAYYDLQDYQKAIADFNQAISIDPELTLAYNNRGLVYYDLKDYQSAIADFTKAISIDPELALAYNNRGIAYRELKEYEKAIADYTKAISLDPQYLAAYYNRGVAYRDLNDYERAIADFGQVISLDPEYADAYNNRGLTYALLGKYNQARSDAEKAAQLYRQQGNEAGYQLAQKLITLIDKNSKN